MDIDIDFADRSKILSVINHIPATIIDSQTKKHNTGVYCQNIPFDPISGLASLDYRVAESRGYFKLDFLNMSVYQSIKDADHYTQLLSKNPPWHKLWQDQDFVSKLVHIGNYWDLLECMKPDSVPRMAAFISVIRPGKAHLQKQSWDQVFASVWDGDDSRGYTFKKAHAISYAQLVCLHMNIIEEV